MPYCSNCGNQITDNAKFCSECGQTQQGIQNNSQGKRTVVFDGKIHKCPNCGETLQSFIINCPSCGYELRGTKNSTSVSELAAKIEEIESKREHRKTNALKNLYIGQPLTKADEQKISLIRNFSIPNTKEDLYEFLILSVSNIDVDSYENDNQLRRNDVRLAESDAWKAKFEQAYQKAKLLFENDPKLAEIEKLYEKTNKSIKNSKQKTWRLLGIIYGGLALLLVVIFAIVLPLSKNSAEKKMEEIVSKIEIALSNEEYKLALMYADCLIIDSSDTDLKREWEIQREYWIDKVTSEAEKNSVIIDYTPHYHEEENTNINKTETYQNGFVNGFVEGAKPGLDAAEIYINEFNEILNKTESSTINNTN